MYHVKRFFKIEGFSLLKVAFNILKWEHTFYSDFKRLGFDCYYLVFKNQQ